MPVTAQQTRFTYTGNGVTTTFAFGCRILAAAHLQVQVNGVVQTSGYSVTGVNNPSGGNVVFSVAPANGAAIIVERVMPLERATDYQANGDLLEQTLDDDQDAQTMLLQQVNAAALRAIRAPSSDSANLNDLPVAALRANLLLGFDGNGNPIATAPVAGSASALATQLASSSGSSGVGFLQSGTGAVARTVAGKLGDYVSVKDFGATGDGTTNDTAAIAAALAAHLNVYFPAGTYNCGQLTLRTGHNLIGAGQGATTILHRAATNAYGLFGTGVSNIRIASMTLDGNSANNLSGGMGVRIEGISSDIKLVDCRLTNWRFDGLACVSTGAYVDVENCRVDGNLRDGASFTSTLRPSVSGSRIVGNGRFGVVFGAGCNFARLANNILVGNSATDASGCGALAVSCSDVTFNGNVAASNTLGHGLQFNTVTRGAMTGNVSQTNGISGLDSFASQFVSITGNNSHGNAVRGIEIDSAAYYNTCVGNIVSRNGGAGISVYRSPGTLVANNSSTENGTTLAEKFGIRLWDDINTLPSNNCRVIGNLCTDDRGGLATQTHGISIEAASTTGVVLIGNNLTPNVTGPVSTVAGAIARARDNAGFVTQNEGTSSIAAASTNVTINHGLSVTPTSEAFSFCLTSLPTNAVDQFSVDNITATQFRVNVRIAPGAGGLNFRWRANAY